VEDMFEKDKIEGVNTGIPSREEGYEHKSQLTPEEFKEFWKEYYHHLEG